VDAPQYKTLIRLHVNQHPFLVLMMLDFNVC